MRSGITAKKSRESFFTNPKNPPRVFALSLVVFLYYLIGYVILSDVYKFPVVGIVYELLWLPMLVSLVAVPVAGFLMLIKQNAGKWFALAALILVASAIFILSKR